MTAFTEIAIPHKDILEGRFTLEAYASDLWEVVKGTAPEEYRDRELFFERTFETEGLKSIVEVAKRRLEGQPSDPVVQIQTPFGGGKTHALIYLYHKAKEWNTKVFVFSGDKISAKESTLWEEMERQLTGKVEEFKGRETPGGEKLKEFLSQHEPLLLLMDEIHAYLVSASAIGVGESNLASQSLLFIQYLTTTVRSLHKTVMFVSLPTSSPYADVASENLLNKLKGILGRVEKVYTPVSDEEVANVIRRRLFSKVNEDKAKKVIRDFLDFAERENLLPQGVEKSYYRDKFLKTYPFQPEVIDVLYKRWGSFPTFQRTRGVLRLLALVVHSLINHRRPYIRLADFDLSNENIRRELIKHIGTEYDSIIAQDITSKTSGAKKVDRSLGDSYKPYNFGTAVATTIFMYSFSGAGERGATIGDIKLSASEISIGSSIIVETIEKLKENLFYLADEGLFFKNRPNLNKVLLDKVESISVDKVETIEKDLLKSELKGSFETYIWPQSSGDVPDTPSLKLVILRKDNGMKEIYENYRERPRVYKNVLLFLVAEASERAGFEMELKKKLAWEMVAKDSNLALTEEQKREVKEKIKRLEGDIKISLRNLYRKVYVPSRNGLKEIDLGIAIYGKERSIDQEVYERLKTEGEIILNLSPKVLLDKYLQDRDYVEIRQIYESFLKVPGEVRMFSKEEFKEAIKRGIKEGLFGLGRLEENQVNFLYFKEDCEVNLSGDEVLIRGEWCQIKSSEVKFQGQDQRETKLKVGESTPITTAFTPYTDIESEEGKSISSIKLEVQIPSGKFSEFIGPLRLINARFKKVKVKISIEASEGSILKREYDSSIKEAFSQSGIIVEKEEKR